MKYRDTVLENMSFLTRLMHPYIFELNNEIDKVPSTINVADYPKQANLAFTQGIHCTHVLKEILTHHYSFNHLEDIFNTRMLFATYTLSNPLKYNFDTLQIEEGTLQIEVNKVHLSNEDFLIKLPCLSALTTELNIGRARKLGYILFNMTEEKDFKRNWVSNFRNAIDNNIWNIHRDVVYIDLCKSIATYICYGNKASLNFIKGFVTLYNRNKIIYSVEVINERK